MTNCLFSVYFSAGRNMYNKSDKSDSESRFVDKYKLRTLQKHYRLPERISLTMSFRVKYLITKIFSLAMKFYRK